VPVVHKISSFVTASLLPNWPDNVLLQDLVKAAVGILGHSVFADQSSYRLALEGLLSLVRDWNKNAHAKIRIDESEVEDILEAWRKKEIADCRSLPQALLRRIESDSLKSLFNLAQMWATSIALPRVSRRILLSMLCTYVQSSTATDFKARVDSLDDLAKVFGAVDRQLEALVQNCSLYFSQFVAEAELKAKEKVKEVTKNVAAVLKVFSGKKRLQDKAVQLTRQINKVEGESLEILKTALPLLTPPPAAKNSDDKIVMNKMPPKPVLPPPATTTIFKFFASDGSCLGSTSEMHLKMRKPLSALFAHLEGGGIQAVADQITEMSCGLDGFLEQLASKALDKQKYKANKIVEQYFKDFRDDLGLSYRIGSMYALSSRNLLSEFDFLGRGDVMSCLAQYDVLQRNLLKPEKHVTPMFLERSKGFASHSLVHMVTLQENARRNVESCGAIREALTSFRADAGFEERLRNHWRTIGLRLRQLSSCVEAVAELYSAFESVYIGRAVASWRQVCEQGSFDEQGLESLGGSLGEFRKRVLNAKGDHQTHLQKAAEHTDAIEWLLAHIPSGNVEGKELPSAVKEKISKSVQSTLQKMLNGLQKARHGLLLQEEIMKDEPAFKSMERLQSALNSMQLGQRCAELKDIKSTKDNLERLGYNACFAVECLSEAEPIVQSCLNGAEALLSASGQLTKMANAFVFRELLMLSKFCSHEFAEEEPEDGGKGQDKDNLEGCGLGEGKGEKATTEGVDSEDLFENASEEKKEEEEEDDKEEDKKDEDHIDYSEKLEGENKDMEEKNESDDNSDDESDNEDKVDQPQEEIEEDKANDEELKPEDWGDEEEEEKENKDEGEEDQENGEENNENKEGKEEEHKKDDKPDDKQQQQDEEHRLRQPDEQTGEDIENQEEDNYHDPDFKEEEVEDLDMEDDANMDGNDDDEEEMDVVRILVLKNVKNIIFKAEIAVSSRVRGWPGKRSGM
jgi:hypothetical protein